MLKNNFYFMDYPYKDLVAIPFYSQEHMTADGVYYHDPADLVGHLLMLKDKELGYFYEDGNLEKLNDSIFNDSFIYDGIGVPLSTLAIGTFNERLTWKEVETIARQLNPHILGKKYRIEISFYS